MRASFADRLFRLSFIAAGIYNFAFGIWTALWPRSFFQLLNISQPNYPQLWSCLGMVVGVYGLLYIHAARKLDAAWPIIAVGLLGKILGPIGMVISFSDTWPPRLGMLCVYNDLIWWLPFACFLIRRTYLAKIIAAASPGLCALVHIMALVMLALVLRFGGAVEPDAVARARYIAAHPAAWCLGWATWMLAAASLVGFYAWWGSRIAARNSSAILLLAALIAALGMVCDLSGEGLMVLWMPERVAASNPQFEDVERAFTVLCAGGANGLYTLAGLMLTSLTRGLPGWVRAAMWTTWLAGAVMTLAAILGSIAWISISSAVLFPLLITWTLWMALRWRLP